MGRIEQVITPLVRGAGRVLDITFPQPNIQVDGNVQVGITCVQRPSYTTYDWMTSTGFGVPPAGTKYTTYKGRIAHNQTGSGTAGGFNLSGGAFAIYFPQNKNGASPYTDDFRCWRITALMAFPNGGNGTSDTGLEIGPGLNYDMIVGTPPGFRLGPDANTTSIGLQVRKNGGGAFTVNQTVAQADTREWHMYEMRFIGATDKTDAVFKAFVDGANVASFSWGAGTLLPGFANGTSLGYMIGFGNRGVANTVIAMGGLQVSAAPTEDALL